MRESRAPGGGAGGVADVSRPTRRQTWACSANVMAERPDAEYASQASGFLAIQYLFREGERRRMSVLMASL